MFYPIKRTKFMSQKHIQKGGSEAIANGRRKLEMQIVLQSSCFP